MVKLFKFCPWKSKWEDYSEMKGSIIIHRDDNEKKAKEQKIYSDTVSSVGLDTGVECRTRLFWGEFSCFWSKNEVSSVREVSCPTRNTPTKWSVEVI